MHPLLRRPRWACLILAATAVVAGVAGAQPALPTLSLDEALVRAARADPGVAAAQDRAAAAAAAVRQAGLKPLPSLALEVENFAGSDPYSGFDRTEATLSYERPYERGGKRKARTARARAEAEVVRLRGEVRRLDHLRDVQLAYAEAQAAEAERQVAEARFAAAQRSLDDIARRVRSARDPLFAGSRAEALLAQSAIARDRKGEAARAARAVLAAYWGGAPDVAVDLGAFFNARTPTELPPADPSDLALLVAERDVALATVRVETANGVADPTLRAGVRYFGEGNAAALVVGGSIPLGARAANQANVDRAQAERAAAEHEIDAARLARAREIARLTLRLRALAQEADRIEAEVVPPAVRTVEQVTEGFNRGGFEYIDVTEAQRALADARARRVEVLRDFHADMAALDRLTGKHRGLVAAIREERR